MWFMIFGSTVFTVSARPFMIWWRFATKGPSLTPDGTEVYPCTLVDFLGLYRQDRAGGRPCPPDRRRSPWKAGLRHLRSYRSALSGRADVERETPALNGSEYGFKTNL